MNRLILISILWCLANSIGRSQETFSGSESVPESPPVYGIPMTATPIGLPGPPHLPRTEIPAVVDRIAQLRSNYEAANKQAHDLAESLRQTPDAVQKSDLRTAVQRAFTLRQSLLRAELQEMQARLEKTQQSLDMRDRSADQIVDRRVEDLLNPELKWEGTPQFPPAENADTAVSGSSNLTAPIGLGLPEEIDAGAWGEPQNGLRLAIVVKSENSLWNKAQEVQYVVENVSKEKIALRGQRNDQLATLFEVRQTSQAQVQTMPRVNSGVQETGSNIELGPSERAVIARVWMGVVEKQTDAIPESDPQLLIIDSDAWEFRNKIYVVRGCLQPDPEQPTVTIRSGQVAIAFYKPADTSIGSLPASSPPMPDGEEKPLDSKESLLSALQGAWDVKQMFQKEEKGELTTVSLKALVDGNRISLSGLDGSNPATFDLQLGAAGPPQQVDLKPVLTKAELEDLHVNQVPSVNVAFPGIIEVTIDGIRLCLGNSESDKRPIVFAAGPATGLWELRRTPAAIATSELEGDWHLVAYIDKRQTNRRPINMTIRANQKTVTRWTGVSVSGTVVVNQNAGTIEVGANELTGGRPNQVISERGTYILSGDLLTIHSEYTISDSVSGADIQKGQYTNIWKRGLCKIEDYDPRNPGHGMGICHLNGSDENTGLGKLLPGDKVDVLVSLASKDHTTAQRVFVENIEVDGSSEPTQGRPAQRQISLLGTREQCLIIDDANMRGVTLSVSRKLDEKTQQFPGGINIDAVKEMKEVAPRKSLDVSKPTPFP